MNRNTGLLSAAGCLTLSFALFILILTGYSLIDIHKKPDDVALTDWKFIWSTDKRELEGDIEKWNVSSADAPVQKPPQFLYGTAYVRLRTSLPEIERGRALKLITANSPVKVHINGNQVYNNRYESAVYSGNRINTIPLDEADGHKPVDIYMGVPYAFSLSAYLTYDTGYSGISSLAWLVTGSAFLAVGLISFLILIVAAVKSENKAELIWLSFTFVSGGAGAFLYGLSMFSRDLLSPLIFKAQLSLTLFTFAAMFCTSVSLCGKWKRAEKITAVLMLAAVLIFSFTGYEQGLWIVAVYPLLLLAAAVVAMFKFRYALRDRSDYAFLTATVFMIGAFCGIFDMTRLFTGWSSDVAGLRHIEIAIYCCVTFFVTIVRALYKDIGHKEHKRLVERNNLWVEKAVSSYAGIFAQQSIPGFCRETARAVKELLIFDNKVEGDGKQSPDDLHISMAFIRNGEYGEIYTENQIEPCSYQLIVNRAQNLGDKPVLIGEHTLDMLFYLGGTPACILHIDGINNRPSSNLQNTLKNSYVSISSALNSLELKEDIVELQENVFINLAEIAEQKQADIGAHLHIVSEMVKVICEQLGMSEHETHIVSMASMVHDIGKLAIPEGIISKKGKLTDDEFAIMQDHVIYGYNMMSKSPGEFMSAAAIIAQQHHEKYDGTGYIGLAGEQIHIYARIVAIADVLDALLSERSYKRAWTAEHACQYIDDNSGVHFDPKLVETFDKCKHKLISIKKLYS